MDRPKEEDSKDSLLGICSTSISFSSSSGGNVIFSFKLPVDGLALRSASIVNGVPRFHFVASPKVPTIQEEDVATSFRLISENERPGFFYGSFPPTHPMHECRYFMQYSPDWLRWTSVGKLLAEADWNMKCLHVGLRSNEEKTVFKSWSAESELRGLATCLDFPKDGLGPIMMSCDHVKVQKDTDEIFFPEEPKMKITDLASSLYSKYITAIYSSVAYHDEPVLLKMQELIKLIVVIEWLYKEKGIRVNQEWVMGHTSKLTDTKDFKRSKPPYSMIPRLTEYECPTKDVPVNTREAQLYHQLEAKCSVERRYGYLDVGSKQLIMFKDDGTTCPPQKCMKFSIECYPSSFWSTPLEVYSKLLPLPANEDTSHQEVVSKVQENDEQEMSTSAVQSMRMTAFTRVVMDNPDFKNGDPNMPTQQGLIPNVKNWDELISELSVPIPLIQQAPFVGLGEPMATGGVTTSHFNVMAERPGQKRAVQEETEHVGNYSRRGDTLMIHGEKVRSQGNIQKIGDWEIFEKVSGKFLQSWIKKTHPPVDSMVIFAVSNPSLERKWMTYRQSLLVKESEEHFHGTTLACNITRSGRFCKKVNCGVCGISSEGLDSAYIGKKVPFERFGRGFYLAPNSSKCHDYTEGADGYRAMLLCDVLPGRKYIIETKDQKLTGPPPGFNSVYGQVGCELNYPEIVVYSPDAVMPRYIILYKKDGVKLPLGM